MKALRIEILLSFCIQKLVDSKISGLDFLNSCILKILECLDIVIFLDFQIQSFNSEVLVSYSPWSLEFLDNFWIFSILNVSDFLNSWILTSLNFHIVKPFLCFLCFWILVLISSQPLHSRNRRNMKKYS